MKPKRTYRRNQLIRKLDAQAKRIERMLAVRGLPKGVIGDLEIASRASQRAAAKLQNAARG